MEGTVKFFNRRKGFGFITGDDGQDYFVHFTALPQDAFLREEDRVTFDPAQGDRGLKAENVQVGGSGAAPAEAPAEEAPEAEEPAEEAPEAEEPAEEAPEAEEPAEEAPEAEEPAEEAPEAEEPAEEAPEAEAPKEE